MQWRGDTATFLTIAPRTSEIVNPRERVLTLTLNLTLNPKP